MNPFVRSIAVATLLLLAPGTLRPENVEAQPSPAPAARPIEQSASGLLIELRRQRMALERREAALEARELAAAELEQELARRIGEFEKIRLAIESRLDAVEESLGDQLGRLAKTYAAMPPDRAAVLLETLESELASSILRRMRHKKTAAVLAGMTAERAQDLSRRLVKPFNVDRDGGAPASPRRGGQR